MARLLADMAAGGQKYYYRKAINAIREVNQEIPIIISDGWFPDQWVKYVNENGGPALNLVVDCHVYRCFSDDDKKKSADAITQELDSSVLTNLSGEADLMVGEYSCVLDGDTWGVTEGDRNCKVKEFGKRQQSVFKGRAGFGNYFWCYKFEHGDGGEWGFIPMVNQGCIPSRPTTCNLPSEDDFKRELDSNFQGHINYWNSQNANENWEHWRYQEGFTTAWADCLEFAKFENSRIGRLHAWKYSRRQEHINNRGESGFLWEWDQGFDKAVEYFSNLD
ncbi:unnamed protein product [Ambrosiozyma monospora]|uniref:Unnamed protein product n=1 Tax=Ambrosiozyma monospora TaxID=43982 RepID=A0ACB5U646_AMBMO|nr:unnamed protein product [Ambrosiozyma monospora]